MCHDCHQLHGTNKFSKKHLTIPIEKVKQEEKLPVCPTHKHMFLDLYCEDCEQPMCATCVPLEHMNHKCVNIAAKMESFKSDLDKVLSQTDMCLTAVHKAILTTQQQSNKMKNDVDALKKETSSSYKVIIQEIQKQERRHMKKIDDAYQQAQKMIYETMDKQQTTESVLNSIKLYGGHLREQGTVYDYTTNLKSLIDRSQIYVAPPSEIKWEIDVKWGDWNVDTEGVSLSKQCGFLETAEILGNHKDMVEFVTKYNSDNAHPGIAACHGYLLMSIGTTVEGYSKDEQLTFPLKHPVRNYGQLRISSRRQAQVMASRSVTLCLVGGAQYLVFVEKGNSILWWHSLTEEGKCLNLGEPQKHQLNYNPSSAVTDYNGQLLVADEANGRLYSYSGPGVAAPNITSIFGSGSSGNVSNKKSVSAPGGSAQVSSDRTCHDLFVSPSGFGSHPVNKPLHAGFQFGSAQSQLLQLHGPIMGGVPVFGSPQSNVSNVAQSNAVQLNVKPRMAVSNPTGGYVVIDLQGNLIWINNAGSEIRRYTDTPAVHADHIVHDGNNWLVVDSKNHCVHRVTGGGKHAGYLITQEHGITNPSSICVDDTGHYIWVTYIGPDSLIRARRINNIPPHVTKINLFSKLYRIKK